MRMDGGAWGCSGVVNIIVISIMIVLSFKRQVTDNLEVTLGKKENSE